MQYIISGLHQSTDHDKTNNRSTDIVKTKDNIAYYSVSSGHAVEGLEYDYVKAQTVPPIYDEV